MSHTPKRFLRMSFRTWFLIFSVLCLAAFAYTRVGRTSRVEANAIRSLENLGIKVEFFYEHELGEYGSHIPPGSDWTKSIFGEKVLARIGLVTLSGELKTLDDCGDYLKQLTHLKSLCLMCNELENIDALKHLKGLEEVSLIGNFSGVKNADALSSLKLSEVYLLGAGPTILDSVGEISSLEKISINVVNLKELDLNDWKTTNLQQVKIRSCGQLVKASGPPQGCETCSFTFTMCNALEEITFRRGSNLGLMFVNDCPQLRSIGAPPDSLEGIREREPPRFSSIYVDACNNLVSFNMSFEDTEQFSLTQCDGMKDLDFSQSIPKLKRVTIESCNGLTSITGMPESVEALKLINCQSLVRVTPEDNILNLKSVGFEKCPKLLRPPKVRPQGNAWDNKSGYR